MSKRREPSRGSLFFCAEEKIMFMRPIRPSDNQTLATIIRRSLEEFNLNIPGTVYTDPTTDQLYELFQKPGSAYFVLEEAGKVIGGCGVFPTEGLPKGCAELVKLYLIKEFRGGGRGKALMEKTISEAMRLGFMSLYLETFKELGSAVGLYEKLGFVNLPGPLGNSGHFSCEIWMLKQLT
jgi:putative acetyltransferase